MNPEPDLSARTLTLTRTFDAPPERVYRAWTEPALYKQWNVPRPWVITEAELDPRPGGTNFINMRSPEGVDYPDAGIYLEVIPGRRLVFTDAYTAAWLPSEKPFMTVSVDFEPLEGGAKTRRIHQRAALVRRRPRGARAHGLTQGLGPVRRSACRAACQHVIASPSQLIILRSLPGISS